MIQAGYELNVQDHDGWTPLHAAAHWGVKEACSILAEALCDMDVRNKLVSGLPPAASWSVRQEALLSSRHAISG